MRKRPEQIEALTRVCVDDLLSAFALGGLNRGRRLLELLSRVPAQRVARQIANYDQIVGESGLGVGGAWALEQMVRRAEIEGRERVPTEGPLLLVSNHPGLSDAVALFSSIPRADLRVIAAQWPLLDALPNTSQHLITVAKDSSNRSAVLKSAARHLQRGGALLNFPAGRMEPDPAVLPGAVESLGRWSTSVDLFARLAPDLTVVPVAVSGVFSPIALRNPLTNLRHREEDRWWLASNLQMLLPALRNVTMRVTFGVSIRTADAGDAVSQRVLAEMRRLIERCEAQRIPVGRASRST
ncbi:MAG TPA: 1-acyl-sn-glycerol-3-phosphate acyltransferase [Burkholderiaceae bacterium]|nr:1-acyl-sn-glycerol-3-phosphate acyltransferase [Burkholderiaceae bacterium]